MIARIGQALYGHEDRGDALHRDQDAWRSRMAQDLGVSYRTVRRWELGKIPVPEGVLKDCLELLERRGSACAGLAAEVAGAIGEK